MSYNYKRGLGVFEWNAGQDTSPLGANKELNAQTFNAVAQHTTAYHHLVYGNLNQYLNLNI